MNTSDFKCDLHNLIIRWAENVLSIRDHKKEILKLTEQIRPEKGDSKIH